MLLRKLHTDFNAILDGKAHTRPSWDYLAFISVKQRQKVWPKRFIFGNITQHQEFFESQEMASTINGRTHVLARAQSMQEAAATESHQLKIAKHKTLICFQIIKLRKSTGLKSHNPNRYNGKGSVESWTGKFRNTSETLRSTMLCQSQLAILKEQRIRVAVLAWAIQWNIKV